MAGRRGNWRRLRGDTDRPELVKFGEKLLGYLDTMRRLGRAKTQGVTRHLANGAVVRARYVGDHPIVEIDTSTMQRETVELQLLQGVVVHPRSYTNAAAFGQYPDVLCLPSGETWRTRVYDGAWQPDPDAPRGVYRTCPQGPLFEAGLTVGGCVDWRSADELLVVTWDGPSSRYFPRTRNFGGKQVFHNGVALVDITAIPAIAQDTTVALSEWGVHGACLRRHGAQFWLYVAACHAWPGFPSVHRLFRAPLEVDEIAVPWWKRVRQAVPPNVAPPVFKPPAADVFEPVGAEQRWPYQASQGIFTLCAFSASGREARTLVYEHTNGSFGDPIRVIELVWNLADPTAPSLSRYEHAVLTELHTSNTTYGPARLSAGDSGLHQSAYGANGAVVISQIGDISYLYPERRDYFSTLIPTVPEYPCAVDFVGETPVYAYARTRSTQDVRTYTSSYSQSVTGVVADIDADPVGTHWQVQSQQSTEQVTEASSTSIEEEKYALRCTDEHGVAWLELQCTEEIDRGYSRSAQAVHTYTRTPLSSQVQSYSSTSRRTDVTRRHGFAVHGLDLRKRAALIATHTTERSVTTEASGTPAGGENVSTTSQTTVAETRVCRTRVIMDGVEVETWEGARPAVNSTSSSTTTRHVGSFGMIPPSEPEAVLNRPSDQAAFEAAFYALTPITTNVGPPYPYSPGIFETLRVTPEASSASSVAAPILDHTKFDASANTSANTLLVMGGSWTHQTLTGRTNRAGEWARLRDRYVYSIPDLSGDTTVPKWRSRLDYDHTMSVVTGYDSAQAFAPLWVLSATPIPK